MLEQVVLARAELELPARVIGTAGRTVDAHVAGEQLVGPGTAHVRAHAGEQLGDAERLGDVIVGAGVEPGHGVELGRAAGQDQDRGLGALGADQAAGFETVHPGHLDVEDHQRVVVAGAQPRGLDAVGRLVDLIALAAQDAREREADAVVVLGDQQASHRASLVAITGCFSSFFHLPNRSIAFVQVRSTLAQGGKRPASSSVTMPCMKPQSARARGQGRRRPSAAARPRAPPALSGSRSRGSGRSVIRRYSCGFASAHAR